MASLTDHFKSALNNTKAQLFQGPSLAGHMTAPHSTFGSPDVVGPPPIIPIMQTQPVQVAQPIQVAQPMAQPVQVAQPVQATLLVPQADAQTSSFQTFWKQHGNKIIFAAILLIAAAIVFFWWFRRNRSRSSLEIEEIDEPEEQQRPRRNISRPSQESFRLPAQLPSAAQTTQARPAALPQPSNLTLPAQPQQNPTHSLKDQEQSMSVRGADFANPALVAAGQMRAMSTRGNAETRTPLQPPVQQQPIQPVQQQQPPLPPIQQQQQPVTAVDLNATVVQVIPTAQSTTLPPDAQAPPVALPSAPTATALPSNDPNFFILPPQ